MAWVSGTCTGHLELLDALKTFLTSNAGLVAAGQAWECLADVQEQAAITFTDDVPTGNHRTLYFKAKGLSGLDEIYIGLQDWQWVSRDIYNIALQGLTGYLAGVSLWNQPGAVRLYGGSELYNLTLQSSGQAISYWFIANGRRVIIITRIANTYCTAYLGLFLPFSRPDQYPYPLFAGGSSYRLGFKYSNESQYYLTNFFKPLYNDSNYSNTPYYNRYCSAFYWNGTMQPIRYGTVDYSAIENSYWSHQIIGYIESNNFLKSFGFNEDGSRPMCPLDIASPEGIQGRLDGVAICSGKNANPEDYIADSDGTSNWILIPNVRSVGDYDFAAFHLI